MTIPLLVVVPSFWIPPLCLGAVAILVFVIQRRLNNKTYFIDNPAVLLALIGSKEENQSLAEMDHDVLKSVYKDTEQMYFSTWQEFFENIEASPFNFIQIYLDLNDAGVCTDLAGVECRLEEIITRIQNAGTNYLIFANDNALEAYQGNMPKSGILLNLICTVERQGDNFPSFMRKLFARVSKGERLPLAWNALAPVRSANDTMHDNAPATIAVMGQASVVLRETAG